MIGEYREHAPLDPHPLLRSPVVISLNSSALKCDWIWWFKIASSTNKLEQTTMTFKHILNMFMIVKTSWIVVFMFGITILFFGQRLNGPISNSSLCSSAVVTHQWHESERTKPSSEIKTINLFQLLFILL